MSPRSVRAGSRFLGANASTRYRQTLTLRIGAVPFSLVGLVLPGTGPCPSDCFSQIARMSAAYEAAFGKLGLVDRSDPATMAVGKLIIEFAKTGERDPERLCALALQQLSK